MGKKKATKTKKLLPKLKEYFDLGNIHCHEISFSSMKNYSFRFYASNSRLFKDFEISQEGSYYKVDLGSIISPITAFVKINSDGRLSYGFYNTNFTLKRPYDSWFGDQLGQIITLYKMGMYQSSLDEYLYDVW